MGLYEVKTEVTFAVAHRLLSYDGPCNRVHGHNLRAEVCVSSRVLTDGGFVVDFGELKKVIKGWIDRHWDHGLLLHEDDILNNIGAENAKIYVMPDKLEPTAENLAKILFDVVQVAFPDTRAEYVSISETPTNTAIYRRY